MKKLNAFTDEERAKLASLTNGGGTNERLTTVRSLDLVLSGSEQVIEFDPAQTSRAVGLSVTGTGTILVGVDGFYQGDLSLFVDKSGGVGANLSVWIEIKPLATGVWELASQGMSNPIVYDDGGQPVALAGSIDALAGDEIRIKIKENAGTATLTSETKTVALGNITDFAASLTVVRVGPITA